MNKRRAFLTSSLLSIPAVGGLALLTAPPAKAVLTWNSAVVPVAGIVSGQPESVSFSGQANLQIRLSRDEVNLSRIPSLLLYIDLSSVAGVGSSTKKKYVITGPEIVQRPLAASDTIEFAFPFVPSGPVATSGATSARNGVASFTLSFDLTTGAVTSGTGSIAAPNYPA
jgi:hypothetical protein